MKLIFVHGFLGSALNWGPLTNKLKRMPELDRLNLEISAIDLLGHGRKASLPVPNSRAIVDDLIQDLPEGNFVALGHSFGLRPLLQLPDALRKRMKALIVEDSTPIISESGFLELEYIFKKIPVPFTDRPTAKKALEDIFGAESRMARFLMTNIRENAEGKQTWRFDSEGLYRVLEEAFRNNLWPEWESYQGPIYNIFGGQSSFVPQMRQEESVQRRPGLETHIFRIPQSGHWVHADQPELFAAQLAQILLDISSKNLVA